MGYELENQVFCGIASVFLREHCKKLICTCFGFAFQPLGQKYLPAENAAVLTVINPLTASIMGIIFAHELLSPLKIAGYIIILSTLYIYNSRLGEKKCNF